jgi:DNA-binding CsgD family transcriptional regulator
MTTSGLTRTDTLTNREQHVVALVGRGLSNQEIADELSISARTVKCTLHRASVRLGAHNRVQAVIFALRRGIISITDVYSVSELTSVVGYLPTELLQEIWERVEGRNGKDRFNGCGEPSDNGNGAHGSLEEELECVRS